MTLIFSQEQLWNHQKPGREGPCWIHHQFQLPWLQLVHSYGWCQEHTVVTVYGAGITVAGGWDWRMMLCFFLLAGTDEEFGSQSRRRRCSCPDPEVRLGTVQEWGIMGNVFHHRDGMLAVVVQLLILVALNRPCVWAPLFYLQSHESFCTHTSAHTRIIFTQINWLINK